MTATIHSLTGDGTALLASPQLRRLQAAVQDLIIASYQHSTKRPGRSLSLVGLTFACSVKEDGKCSTLYAARVRDHELNVTETYSLAITVKHSQYEESEC